MSAHLSENDIAGLFDHLPMVVFYAKDKDGVFTRCNRRFEEFHGLDSGGAIGLTDFDLLSRTDLPLSEVAVRAGFYDASDFGKRFREQEGTTPRKYRMKLQGLIRTDR